MTEVRSIHTKEAAKLLRTELKRRFPKICFSVRYEHYSMGSHIEVRWTDGPAKRTIEAIACAYSGSRFDGMNDSTYYVKSWLMPDGSAVLAMQDRGLTLAPDARAELVTFHGSLPHCERTISAAYEARCARAWEGLSLRERGVLVTAERFPQWEGYSEGYKLACFLDAAQIMASQGDQLFADLQRKGG